MKSTYGAALWCLAPLLGGLTACTGTLEPQQGPGAPADGSDKDDDDDEGSTEPKPSDDDEPDEPSGSPDEETGQKPRPMNLEGAPLYSRFHRLTNSQWANSTNDLLKVSVDALAANFERPVAGTTDFANNEHVLTVSKAQVDSYRAAAEQAAAQATASKAKLAEIYDGTDGAGLIEKLGRRAYRRPLSTAEKTRYATLFASAASTYKDQALLDGARLVITALLQSPSFLYRTELSPDGAPLDGYEIAAKLALWLRGTAPDDGLLELASTGKLDDQEGVAATAAKLLDEPAALAVMREFHRELLHFDRYSNISKVNVASYTEELNAEYMESSYLFFDRIFASDLGVRDILTSSIGYVGPNMAKLYGVEAPAEGYAERDLGPERKGYFTQLPFLTLYAFNEQPDPIHRGVSLNLDMLCADPGQPAALPPIPPLKAGQTNRERISNLTSGCGGECHNSIINPVGFAFENFDGMGNLREKDNGLPVQTAGTYPFVEGVKAFDSAPDLMELMAEGKQAHACYAKKVASYALQRDIVESDLPLLETLTKASMAKDGSIKKVMLELVKSPAFRTRVGGPKS